MKFQNYLLKVLITIAYAVLLPLSIHAASYNCFIAKENGKIIKQIGKCDQRHPPFSTFKIPLALMGFDSGILSSAELPLVKFTPEIEKSYVTTYNPAKYPNMIFWKKNHTPQTWMRHSVVWYSRYITHKLGQKKLQEYINKFNYGNQNIAGKPGKNDGLMGCWIDSSLQIFPLEQITFLEKLASRSLPVSTRAQENTINLINQSSIFADWKLYGKNGGTPEFQRFVGWIEKNERRIFFAQYLHRPQTGCKTPSKKSKEIMEENLRSIV